jgi:hypothetical protein
MESSDLAVYCRDPVAIRTHLIDREFKIKGRHAGNTGSCDRGKVQMVTAKILRGRTARAQKAASKRIGARPVSDLVDQIDAIIVNEAVG